MKSFSLEKYLENPNRKVVTRQGKSVRIICTDRRHTDSWPIVALEDYGDGEFVIYANIDGRTDMCSENIHDLFFADEEDGLTEFEQCLKSGTNIYVEQGRRMEDWDAKEDTKELLDLARKELQPEFEKELDEAYKSRDEVVYLDGYDKGHEDTLKDLPKWKRNKPNEKYIHNKGYYLTWNELEKLPKEE